MLDIFWGPLFITNSQLYIINKYFLFHTLGLHLDIFKHNFPTYLNANYIIEQAL